MDDGEHDFGYGKPPKATQFKKGQSGNNSGGWGPDGKRTRKRAEKKKAEAAAKDRTLAQRILAIAVETRKAKLNGVPTTMPKVEIIFRQVEMLAATGDLVATLRYFRILKELGAFAPPPPEAARIGAVVLRAPDRTVAEWSERAGQLRTNPDPLHGLPGIDAEAYRKSSRRSPLLEDEVDSGPERETPPAPASGPPYRRQVRKLPKAYPRRKSSG